MTKYVFVTGGVVSSLGKGIAAASLAAILESRGVKITMLKLDPYINVDPGTMSPYQHGEVFVLDDGAEVGVVERQRQPILGDAAHVEQVVDEFAVDEVAAVPGVGDEFLAAGGAEPAGETFAAAFVGRELKQVLNVFNNGIPLRQAYHRSVPQQKAILRKRFKVNCYWNETYL